MWKRKSEIVIPTSNATVYVSNHQEQTKKVPEIAGHIRICARQSCTRGSIWLVLIWRSAEHLHFFMPTFEESLYSSIRLITYLAKHVEGPSFRCKQRAPVYLVEIMEAITHTLLVLSYRKWKDVRSVHKESLCCI
jgi:hypothetical protein